MSTIIVKEYFLPVKAPLIGISASGKRTVKVRYSRANVEKNCKQGTWEKLVGRDKNGNLNQVDYVAFCCDMPTVTPDDIKGATDEELERIAEMVNSSLTINKQGGAIRKAFLEMAKKGATKVTSSGKAVDVTKLDKLPSL